MQGKDAGRGVVARAHLGPDSEYPLTRSRILPARMLSRTGRQVEAAAPCQVGASTPEISHCVLRAPIARAYFTQAESAPAAQAGVGARSM